MDGRVDPTTTLGEENGPAVGDIGAALRIHGEGELVLGEMFEHECCEVTIFTEMQ